MLFFSNKVIQQTWKLWALSSASASSVSFYFVGPRSSLSVPSVSACCFRLQSTTPSTSVVLPQKRQEKAEINMDTESLCKFAHVNYLKDGKDPEIKADSEYPNWLFELDTGPAKKLEEMDPEEDGWLYWRRLRTAWLKQKSQTEQLKMRYAAVQRDKKSMKHLAEKPIPRFDIYSAKK